MKKEFSAIIQEITVLTRDIYQVVFSFDEGVFKHEPGQYVWVVLPELMHPDPRGPQRAFSVSSAASATTTLSIHFRSSDSGYKQTLLSMPLGSKVKISGPYGSAYVPTEEQKKIVLIAGGAGISPFLSILRSLEQGIPHPEYSLLYLNSNTESCLCVDELSMLAATHNFSFTQHKGRVESSLFPDTIDFNNDYFFICGPAGMVDAVNDILKAKGVPFNHMRFEQNYPSVSTSLTEADFILKPGERNVMLQAIQDSRNHVIVTDANGVIIFANSRAQENTGYTFDEMRGNSPRLWGGMMSAEFYQNLWQKQSPPKGFDGEITNRRKNGEIYYVVAHISPILTDQDEVIGYIGTEEDITKEKQIDRAKTEFISLASHQLRTPLSTINWYCEMLLAGDAGSLTEEQKKFVLEAYVGSQRMSKLVSALLNVSRIETGTYMVDPQAVDIVQLTRSVLDESKPQIDEKRLIVELKKDDLPEMMLDQNLMIIILQNLLTNSIKYTPNDGKITIRLSKLEKGTILDTQSVEQDSLLIEVADTGVGIPKSQQRQIFEKLFRADNVKRSNTDGTGLGLYLVKSLIEHCQGKIWFISEEGQGTTFFVLLALSGMQKKEGDKKIQ